MASFAGAPHLHQSFSVGAAEWRKRAAQQRQQRQRSPPTPWQQQQRAPLAAAADAPLQQQATAEEGQAAEQQRLWSGDEEPSTSGRGGGDASSGRAEEALWQQAQRAIQQQQAEGAPPPYDLARTLQLVETAMLAAVAGLAYTLSTLLGLEGYLAYILPLPVVLSALRSGPSAAAKTLTTAFLLLFVLMGPVRALTYLLLYGLLSLTLGACWAKGAPWALSIPAAAGARVAGYAAYVVLSSWVTNENLAALLAANVAAILDQMSVALGTSGAPSFSAVAVTLASLLVVNSIFCVFLMHLLYSILLRGLGHTLPHLPGFLERVVMSVPLKRAELAQY